MIMNSATEGRAHARHVWHKHTARRCSEPLGYVDGMNLYQYVRSNPADLTDPSGLCSGTAPDANETDWEAWNNYGEDAALYDASWEEWNDFGEDAQFDTARQPENLTFLDQNTQGPGGDIGVTGPTQIFDMQFIIGGAFGLSAALQGNTVDLFSMLYPGSASVENGMLDINGNLVLPPPPPATQPKTAIPQELNNPQNQQQLARIMMSEASVGNKQEQTAVAYTVLNRMMQQGNSKVSDVQSAYSTEQEPSKEMMDLAGQLLSGEIPDPTGGATHFYSPVSMPKEGQSTKKFDVKGGLELVPPLKVRNYRPGFAKTMEEVPVEDARPHLYKFFREPIVGKPKG